MNQNQRPTTKQEILILNKTDITNDSLPENTFIIRQKRLFFRNFTFPKQQKTLGYVFELAFGNSDNYTNKNR